MGMNDINEEGTFVWEYSRTLFDKYIIGHKIDYNSPNEDCVYFLNTDFWAAFGCGNTKEYVCEMSLCE
jgi:hypothetical protein